jgi:hypothetical protein
MIDKISGKVAYRANVVRRVPYYPLPRPTLKYDTRLGGYRTDLAAARLRGAPKHSRTSEWDWKADSAAIGSLRGQTFVAPALTVAVTSVRLRFSP